MKKINKIPVFDWFYEQGDIYVTVLINNSELLDIPQSFFEKKMETFVLGEAPTPDMTYDERGISAPMRFGNNRYNCFFPWENISVLSGPNAVIQFAAEEKPKTNLVPVKTDKRRPVLKKKRTAIKSRGHLKVIK